MKKKLALFAFVLVFCSLHTAVANTITVTNEAELSAAILAANSGTYSKIIIDASMSGGKIVLSSSLPVLNPGDGNSYTIGTANGTTVTLDGDDTVRIFTPMKSNEQGTVFFENIYLSQGMSTPFPAVPNSGGVFFIENAFTKPVFRGTGNINFSENTSPGTGPGVGFGGVLRGGEYAFQNDGNVTFTGNSSGTDGGVGYNVTMNFDNNGDVNFLNSKAGGSGGVFASSQSMFNNNGDVLFKGNSSGFYGGVYADSSFVFKNTGDITFAENYSTANLGGAFVTGNAQTMEFNNGGNIYFHDNMANSLHGGAITIANNATLAFAPQGNTIVEFQGNRHGVTFSGGAPDLSTGVPNAIYFYSTGTLQLNPDKGAKILFYDPISGNPMAGTITQDGPGVVQLWGNSKYDGSTTINQGRFQLMLDATYGNSNNHTFEIGSNGVFGVSIDSRDALNVNKHSTLISNTFQADSGGRLYVSGVSALPAGTVIKYEDVVQNGSVITLPESMKINNKLLVAQLLQNTSNQNNGDLSIQSVNDVGESYGYELEYLDELRLDPYLDETMRDFIDDLYNYGPDPGAIDFLATLGGSYVMDSIDAARTRGEMFNGIMLGRMDETNALARGNTTLYRGQSPSSILYLPSRNRLIDKSELWGNFTQNWTRQRRSSGNDYSYTYRPFAVTIGKEREISHWRYGVAAQYQHGMIDSGYLSKTRTKTDGASIGAYAGYTRKNWYAKGNTQLGVARNRENTTYVVDDTHTSGRFLTGLFGTTLEGGRTYHLGCRENPFQLTPHAGAYYFMIMNETFTESGTGPGNYARRFEGMTHNVVEIPFGLRMKKNYEFTGGLLRCQHLTPMVDVMYLRSVADNVAVTQAQMFGGPITTPWNARSDDIGRNIFRLGVGLSGRFCNSVDIAFGYDLESRKRYTAQQFNASLSWSH